MYTAQRRMAALGRVMPPPRSLVLRLNFYITISLGGLRQPALNSGLEFDRLCATQRPQIWISHKWVEVARGLLFPSEPSKGICAERR